MKIKSLIIFGLIFVINPYFSNAQIPVSEQNKAKKNFITSVTLVKCTALKEMINASTGLPEPEKTVLISSLKNCDLKIIDSISNKYEPFKNSLDLERPVLKGTNIKNDSLLVVNYIDGISKKMKTIFGEKINYVNFIKNCNNEILIPTITNVRKLIPKKEQFEETTDTSQTIDTAKKETEFENKQKVKTDSILKASRDSILAKETEFKKLQTEYEEIESNNTLFAVILTFFGLIALVLIGYIVYFHKLKQRSDKKYNDKLSALEMEIKSKEEEILSKNHALDIISKQQTTINVGNNQKQVQQSLQPVFTIQNTGSRYFYAEAMLTAGPRKNFDKDAVDGDFGLGEDVSGFIMKNDHVIFWVLDGTSDSERLFTHNKQEYFSSRLLAQSIGWNIQSAINEIKTSFNAESLLKHAIETTLKDWNNKIIQLEPNDKRKLLSILTENQTLQCSTTIILGILTIQGDLNVCKVGDSKIIAQRTTNDFINDSQKTTGRQFVMLSLNSLQQPELKYNLFSDLRSQTIYEKNIKTVVAMTDGISNQTETWLKQINNLDFSNQKIRETLIHRKENTTDDKAICIVQIKA
jgi:serine/threonine protein phosphatase PrpC